MDIGKLKVDKTFYEGYEDEMDIIITLPTEEYHFWDGYFEDIFGNPIQTDGGWQGFTRDYNECVNMFSDVVIESAVLPLEYLKDLKLYLTHQFEYEETRDVLAKLISIFEIAEKENECVLVRVN